MHTRCLLYKTGVFYYNVVNTLGRDGTILSDHIRKPQSGKDDNEAVVGGIGTILAREEGSISRKRDKPLVTL